MTSVDAQMLIGLPLRAAKLLLDEACQQLSNSIHTGSIKGHWGEDGVELAEAIEKHSNGILSALNYWRACKAFHDQALVNAAHMIKGDSPTKGTERG